jgi:hypothetical protein
MAETQDSAAGQRVFSVFVQGRLVEKDLDLFTVVGKHAAYVRGIPDVYVQNGILDIAFVQEKGLATISGISVEPLGDGVEDRMAAAPQEFSVGQNYPNPFNGQTTIPIRLSSSDDLTMIVYDLLGRKTSELSIGRLPAGQHFVNWNARDLHGNPLASGVYYCVIRGKLNAAAQRVLLVQ